MSWKRKKPPQKQQESNMIEHSICKYKPPIVPIVHTYDKYNGLQQWPHIRCMHYIDELKKRGYIPGVHVTTKWGITGLIEPYPPIPTQGLQFYGKSCPDIIKIKIGTYGNCMSYNEDEVRITLPTELEMVC